MIEQQHNAIGHWELSLKPGVPNHIRSVVENFGHIVITPGVLRGSVDRSTLLANSMYTGLILKHRKKFDLSLELEGANLLTWLGYSETRGPYPSFVGITASSTPTWADIVSTSSSVQMGFFRPIHDATNGIELGTVYGTTTFSGAQGVVGQWPTRHQLSAEGEARQYGAPNTAIEYRVTPAGEFESGNPLTPGFWRRDPEVLLTRDAALVDPALRSLQITDLDVEYDGTTYATEAGAKAADNAAASYSARISDPIQNFTGTSGAKWAVIQNLNDDTADAADRQAAADDLIDYQGESTNLSVSVANHPTLPTFLEPGDYVWIHDPATGLADTANRVRFAGRQIAPVKVRVYGTRWPVMEGRGVYYATNDWQTIHDLGPHMEWEDGDVDIEAGSPVRSKIQLVDTETRRTS